MFSLICRSYRIDMYVFRQRLHGSNITLERRLPQYVRDASIMEYLLRNGFLTVSVRWMYLGFCRCSSEWPSCSDCVVFFIWKLYIVKWLYEIILSCHLPICKPSYIVLSHSPPPLSSCPLDFLPSSSSPPLVGSLSVFLEYEFYQPLSNFL